MADEDDEEAMLALALAMSQETESAKPSDQAQPGPDAANPAVAEFVAITACSAAEAAGYLEAAGGNLEIAMSLFFDPSAGFGGAADVAMPQAAAAVAPAGDRPDWYTLVWGTASPPAAWTEQPLGFSTGGAPYEGVGLLQPRNGPCGVLAVINAVLVQQLRGTPAWGPAIQPTDADLATAIATTIAAAARCGAGGGTCQVAAWAAGGGPGGAGVDCTAVEIASGGALQAPSYRPHDCAMKQ
jgi:hypothetical protein